MTKPGIAWVNSKLAARTKFTCAELHFSLGGKRCSVDPRKLSAIALRSGDFNKRVRAKITRRHQVQCETRLRVEGEKDRASRAVCALA